MNQPFQKALRRVRVAWQGGLLAQALLNLAALAAVACLLYGLADLVFAFAQRTRIAIGLGLGLLFAGLAVLWLAQVLQQRAHAVARWADGALGTGRRVVLTALELDADANNPAHTSLERYLRGEAQARALTALAVLPSRKLAPWAAIGRAARWTALCGAVLAILCAARWDIAYVLSVRLLQPLADMPPYSRLQFTVSPANAAVNYGDDLEVTVDIAGGPVDERVSVMTQTRGARHARACFRESPTRFVQRIENVTSPVRFCFSTGRARSRWHAVELRLQPRIASAHLVVTPPAYSGLQAQSFYLGEQAVAGLPHATLTLDVRSNRPLASGALVLRGRDDAGDEQSVAGALLPPNGMRFEWALTQDADVEVRIQDILGTANAGQYSFRQRLIPDLPPEAMIDEPGAFTLATPDATVQIAGHAEDDIRLDTVSLVRGLAGYRDRIKTLPLARGEPRHTFTQPVDLAMLGVRPGDNLEFYIEASDSNPALTGTVASDLARIQIISRSDYAAMLRLRTTTEAFQARYLVMRAALETLRKTLNTLASEGAAMTPEARAATIADSLKAAQESTATFERIAKDFAIYDMETRLPELLNSLTRTNKEYADKLQALPPPMTGAPALAEAWLTAISPAAEGLQQEIADADEVARLGHVFNSALLVGAIRARQAEIVRRLNRFETGLDQGPRHTILRHARRMQERNHEALTALLDTLAQQRDALPPGYQDLRTGIDDFLTAVREKRVLSLMQDAASAATNEDGPETYRLARLALEAIQSLLEECDNAGNPFTRMLNKPGECPCKNGRCSGTMRQLCEALAAQFMGKQGGEGFGQAYGGGGSIGGNPEDGYWSPPTTLLNTPVIGPVRLDFTRPGPGHQGSGGSAGAGTSQTDASAEGETPSSQKVGTVESDSVDYEHVPERYRDAVRRFYGIE